MEDEALDAEKKDSSFGDFMLALFLLEGSTRKDRQKLRAGDDVRLSYSC